MNVKICKKWETFIVLATLPDYWQLEGEKERNWKAVFCQSFKRKLEEKWRKIWIWEEEWRFIFLSHTTNKGDK